MRPRTGLVLATVCALLVATAWLGFGQAASGSLTERWVSETPRDNEVNHHAVGVGPAGNVIVAPVAAVPNSDAPITNTSCALVRLRPGNGSTRWQTGIAPEHCFTHALTEPAIGDVDGDGALDVVAGTTENALVAYAASNGTEAWRVPLQTYGYGRPTVGDIHESGGLEVVASDIRGGVVAAFGNGSVAWRFDLNETSWSIPSVWRAPIVADLDADDSPEVLIGSIRGAIVLSAAGTVEWRRNWSASYSATGQIDRDPAIEVFAAGESGITAIDGATGDREWHRGLASARLRRAADGDGDGDVELYVGRPGGEFLALDGQSGTTEWSTRVSTRDDAIAPPPVLGDVDADGTDEIVGVLNAGTVVVLDATTGTELASYERTVPIWTVPTVRDIDQDGHAEVLVRYGDGRVVALEYDAG